MQNSSHFRDVRNALLIDKLPRDQELEMPRSQITLSADFLKMIAQDEDEISILVLEDVVRFKRGQPDGVSHQNRYGEKVLFRFHTHPEYGGDQASIGDLDSAEKYQLYDVNNSQNRFFIVSVRGITEYRLSDTLITHLKTLNMDFREYYLTWKQSRFNGEDPSGKTISTEFNREFQTSRFYSWDSPEIVDIIASIN